MVMLLRYGDVNARVSGARGGDAGIMKQAVAEHFVHETRIGHAIVEVERDHVRQLLPPGELVQFDLEGSLGRASGFDERAVALIAHRDIFEGDVFELKVCMDGGTINSEGGRKPIAAALRA